MLHHLAQAVVEALARAVVEAAAAAVSVDEEASVLAEAVRMVHEMLARVRFRPKKRTAGT